MTTDEKLELLPEFLALADINRVPTVEDSSENAEHGVSEVEDASDFVTRSG
jgi:hypothetical protein